ncbi:MAG: YHYH protein, partial [Cyclobacteriaceae bacterium]|nr:YHYH protein [Cyclobacteriaceae bacterium]
MKRLTYSLRLISFFTTILFLSCSNPDTVTPATNEVPAFYKKIYGATSITSDGDFITIKVTGAPDHKSVYYPTNNPLYENFSGSTTYAGVNYTFNKNPNTIGTFNYTFKIPSNPK